MAKRCFEGNQKEKWFDLLLLLGLKGNIWTDSRQHLSGTHAKQLRLYALPDSAKTLILREQRYSTSLPGITATPTFHDIPVMPAGSKVTSLAVHCHFEDSQQLESSVGGFLNSQSHKQVQHYSNTPISHWAARVHDDTPSLRRGGSLRLIGALTTEEVSSLSAGRGDRTFRWQYIV
ncbi:hypothetical protein NQZ68_007651 [Dissostichus eleginoides]|nr:hypothetical protein NQZ68_007651 [Dissostichus eleginoides]